MGSTAPQPTGSPGQPPTFDDGFRELAALAYRVAFRIVGDREDADELTQEALARAYVRWPRVRDRASGWVVTVTTNLALDHVRRRTRRAAIDAARPSVHPTGASPGSAGDPEYAADRADLVAALLALPTRQREVIVLRYLGDLSEAEIARTLGCSPGSVKTHAHRGLAALRSLLGPIPDTNLVPLATEDR